MYDTNNKEQEQYNNTLETLFLKPREYSDEDNYYPHGRPYKTTPIWDMVSTLYKLQRQRDLRKGKITSPTKGTSKYHR